MMPGARREMPAAPTSERARLTRLLCAHPSRRKVVIMLEAYLDDSGSHDDAAVAVLAGYVGPTSEWELLATDWITFLERQRLPFYHAVECAHATEHFAGRTHQACNLLHREVVEIITRRQLVAVGVGVRLEGFRRLYAEKTRQIALLHPTVHFEMVPKMQYQQLYHFALQYLGQYMKAHAPVEQVSIVCEETPGVMGLGLTIEVHEHVLSSIESGLTPYFAGPPAFRPKVGFPQLQAADVFAYEMALDVGRHFEANRKHSTRRAWQALWEHAATVTGGQPMIWCQPWDQSSTDSS